MLFCAVEGGFLTFALFYIICAVGRKGGYEGSEGKRRGAGGEINTTRLGMANFVVIHLVAAVTRDWQISAICYLHSHIWPSTHHVPTVSE